MDRFRIRSVKFRPHSYSYMELYDLLTADLLSVDYLDGKK